MRTEGRTLALPPTMAQESQFTRRRFLGATLGAAALAPLPQAVLAQGAPRPAGRAERLAAELYSQLTAPQREAVCFPYDSPLRARVDNFWFVTPQRLAAFYSPDQQRLAHDIFMALHSEEYGPTVMKQVLHDGVRNDFAASTTIAFFGTPESGRFQMVLTAHHCTRRVGGDAGVAFGGPIFYGHFHERFHERADHPGNVYWYQARRANAVYQMLDGRQRGLALIDGDRRDRGTATVRLAGRAAGLPGIPMSEMSRDQHDEVRRVLADLTLPFRREDAADALRMIDAGFNDMHLAFYASRDIGGDGVWDVWQLEGPDMVWFFNGEPHVHVWAHVRQKV
ncbi:MAG: DUF3500 domain-containing protein [Burkholderiales bacterium]|nr:DUF3500 domain-containing protein [Burkholderiales bacterium]